MARDRADAGDCLRALAAEALLYAGAGQDLLPLSLGLMATANAFVMLGLLPEAQAEAILAEQRAALEDQELGRSWGVTAGELTVRPGAHEFWEARTAGPAGLREIPLRVAAAGIRCVTAATDVLFNWVKATPAGLRIGVEGVVPFPGGRRAPRPPVDQALAEISVTDDHGRRLELTGEGMGGSFDRDRQEWRWHEHLTAQAGPAWPPAWLEFAPAGAGTLGRVHLPAPGSVATGRDDPPWPTPAEGFLAELARTTSYSINGADVGPDQAAGIVAAVADSLMATGALPVTCAWLRGEPGTTEPGWLAPLASRWGRGAYWRDHGFRPAEHLGLAVRLPLEHAAAAIESVSASGELVSVQVYGHPWVMGEYWPMITPCFRVRAVDDAGQEHDGLPGDWQGFPGGEGSGSFWFWPPVDEARTSMRVTVSTLWEAAWADIALPRR